MKKTLIISSYAPPSISGASNMMFNLLRYFEQDKLVFLTSHADIDDNALRVGNKLTAKYYYYDTLTLATGAQKEDSLFQKIKRFLKSNFILRYLAHQAMIFYLPYNIVRYGSKIIRDEKIELLMGYSDQGTAFLATYFLHLLTGKPYYLYFYDLWSGNNFSWTYRTLAWFFEPMICARASKIFVMNDVLQKHYQKKCKNEVVVIYNSIPINLDKKPELSPNQSGKFKIMFTGAIYWAQAGAIKNIIEAVNDITEQDVEFWIYTTYTKEALHQQGIFESSKVFFTKAAPSEMPAIQQSADILLVALSLDTYYPLLINTSSPGKTYEYMLSGRPILVHAPKDSYIFQYARDNDFALTVGENNSKEVKKAILELITQRDLSLRLTDNAFATVLKNHDAKKTFQFFQLFFV